MKAAPRGPTARGFTSVSGAVAGHRTAVIRWPVVIVAMPRVESRAGRAKGCGPDNEAGRVDDVHCDRGPAHRPSPALSDLPFSRSSERDTMGSNHDQLRFFAPAFDEPAAPPGGPRPPLSAGPAPAMPPAAGARPERGPGQGREQSPPGASPADPLCVADDRRPRGPIGPPAEVDLSVVAPAHNEEDNVEPLIDEVATALGGRPELRFEVVVVDDGSTDRTLERLQAMAGRYPWLRVVRMQHTPPGRGLGQSAAFKAGFAATRGRLIAVMDADRQNDPADLPEMLRLLALENADMVQGDRSHNRRDGLGRRVASWVGRTFRRRLLGDSIRDTGCSLRVMKREVALAIPLEFRGMHRFIPVTARHLGFKVIEVPVHHRPRVAGEAKYGVFDRAIPGLIDCLAVRWMRNRRRPTVALEVELQPTPSRRQEDEPERADAGGAAEARLTGGDGAGAAAAEGEERSMISAPGGPMMMGCG